MIEKYLDARELKRLLSTLLAIVGCLIIAALFGILVVPGLRNANRPATPTAVSPVTGETGWLDPTEYPVRKGKVIPPVDPAALIKPTPELTERGKELYEKDCTTCHGEAGRGEGPAAGTMAPRPRDFTLPEGWVSGRDMPGVYAALARGIPGSSMASYDYLPKKDRMALVHYVQSLGGFSDDAGSPEAMQALAEELAAPGEKTNNRIPVSMAIAKLESESAPPHPLDFNSFLDLSDTGFVVEDALRAAETLRASGAWRSGPDALARSILPGIPANGFTPEAALMGPSEWQAMYDELIKQLEMK